MDREVAKELLHVEGWLDRSAEIAARGKDDYLAEALPRRDSPHMHPQFCCCAGLMDAAY